MKTSETARDISMTILHQLGGQHFLVMTGSKNLVYGTDNSNRDFLRMTLVRNASRANRLTVYYNAGMDLYHMVFERITPPRWNAKQYKYSDPKQETVKAYDDVYFDQLQELFTQTTGLLTRLF